MTLAKRMSDDSRTCGGCGGTYYESESSATRDGAAIFCTSRCEQTASLKAQRDELVEALGAIKQDCERLLAGWDWQDGPGEGNAAYPGWKLAHDSRGRAEAVLHKVRATREGQ